jgi:hypothetical protein
MANRSTTTRRTGVSSTQASAVGVYATTGNNYTLIGATIDNNTQFSVGNIQFGAPGVTVPSTSLNSPVVTPTISAVYYTDTNYNILSANAAPSSTASGLRIIGQNFLSNAQVYLQGNVANSTYVNSTELRLPLPAAAATTANTLMVFNSNVSGAVYYPGIVWRDNPTFTIGSNLGFTPYGTFYSNTITATGTGISFSVVSGALPSNVSLNSTTGAISGAIPSSVGPAQQSTFTIRATNPYGLTTDQPFTWMVGYYPVNYFVVAGGGGGAGSDNAPLSPAPTTGGTGGGGAGGLLTGNTVLGYGLPYTISVGAGGGGTGFNGTTTGIPGWSSNIYQGSTAVISTVGGGGGGRAAWFPTTTQPTSIGAPGGSGGGGGAWQSSAPGGTGIPGQGTNGGSGGIGTAGGGGGGASTAGSPGSTPNGGNRGLGLPAAQFGYPGGFAYGGHGGGPAYSGFFDYPAPLNAFTGNAGYGAGEASLSSGGNGSSGTIILAIPTTYYSATYSSPAAVVTTSGGNTIIKFNSSGTYTG